MFGGMSTAYVIEKINVSLGSNLDHHAVARAASNSLADAKPDKIVARVKNYVHARTDFFPPPPISIRSNSISCNGANCSS